MTPGKLIDVWAYLSASPLLHLTMTVGAYAFSDWVYRRSGNRSLLHPVLIAVVMLVAILAMTGTDYATYFDGAQFVHFFLGPATVALAVPLYLNFARLREMWLPLSAGLLAGALTAALFVPLWSILVYTPVTYWPWHRNRSPRQLPWGSPRSSEARHR